MDSRHANMAQGMTYLRHDREHNLKLNLTNAIEVMLIRLLDYNPIVMALI